MSERCSHMADLGQPQHSCCVPQLGTLSSPLPWRKGRLADREGASVQELRKVTEDLAAASPTEQQQAEQRSHTHDAQVAEKIQQARAAYVDYRDGKLRAAEAMYAPLPSETSVPCHCISCFGLLQSL